ncbi:MAG: sugar phosphate isomerase/epimerase [Candidatus Omnitrophica bacterium]|nr:sugar phosphate isomerase/epimerase [Candidatus Omnitrophota bacterium]
MRLSLGSVCYAHVGFEEMMRRAVARGYRHLELICIPGWIHVDLREITARELARQVRDHGMELIALYPGGVDVSDPRTARRNIDYIKRACEYAVELGLERIVFTGCARKTPLSASISAYSELAEHLKGSRVVIALENHFRNRLETIEDYRAVFEALDSPNLGITLDTGHFTSSRVDMFALIEEFGARVKHVHLKDHVGEESVAIGRGETPNREVLLRLAEIGYNGWVSLELEVRDPENTDLYVAEARTLIEEWIAAAKEPR